MIEQNKPEPKISFAGSGAILLDASTRQFDILVQRRIWMAARAMSNLDGISEAVPGMNNLMVVFDPLRAAPRTVRSSLLDQWQSSEPDEVKGREIEVPVIYGGATGEDLIDLAHHCGLSVREVVRLHSEAVYTVAAIGAMPGFPYLSGLNPRLARSRRPSPRMKVEKGSVIIGGAQAGIMPCAAPSGWHIIGRTNFELFDPLQSRPATLRTGDTVRFTVVDRDR